MRTLNTASRALRLSPVSPMSAFALSAWILDPHRNSIGLLQFKAEATG